ncbi:uncharacterized protein METZ01_LOCUS371954 [marine metagenome]|uniref:Uncharacterized protein n=1 Tax=marine metagenome TaxID=408172 RepID=A0A382TAE5_9ZZZZ
MMVYPVAGILHRATSHMAHARISANEGFDSSHFRSRSLCLICQWSALSSGAIKHDRILAIWDFIPRL